MEMTPNKPVIVIYGAGAIGATIGGWISPHYEKIYLLTRGENARVMKTKGLVMYENSLENKQVISVNVIEDLNELKKIDVVIIAVKNYDLEDVAKDIHSKLGDNPIIICLQNGVENQKILPKYFTKIMYGVIIISAWIDGPGVFGHALKGYVIIGTQNNAFQSEMKLIKDIFSPWFKFRISKKIQDAIHTKLISNLSNSIFTLINTTELKKDSLSKLTQIYFKTLEEGILIVEAANFQEHKIPGLLPWSVIRKASLDASGESSSMILTRIGNIGPNSMKQDMVIRQKSQSELQHLNGYIIHLAESFNIKTPYNQIIYKMCISQFKKKPFKQLKVEEIWNELQKLLT